MDERRDLVDREELRRLFERNTGAGYSYSWSAANRKNLAFLDAMPAVECPRGWTREEVLAELDADPDAVCEYHDTFTGEWMPIHRHAVRSWSKPHSPRTNVRVVRVAPEPEWVPLTQLVGRTIDGCSGAVNRFHVDRYHAKWWALHDLEFQDRPFPEGTLNLETGQVAVRPKAAT